MARILTARTVETIKPGAERKEIPDARMPGLYFVVQPSSAKSWAVRYRLGGRTRKHTIGAYPAIDLKAARELAAKALRAVAEHRDPGREKMQARGVQPDTVEAVAALFVERYCLPLQPGPHRGGDATAAQSACPAALAHRLHARHHAARCARPARPHVVDGGSAGRRQPDLVRHPQNVRLGARPRHHHHDAVCRRQAADRRDLTRQGVGRR